MRMIGAFALALVVFGQSFSTAQSTAFVGLGHLGTTDFHVLQSSAHAVSRDGSVVVGGSTSAATDGDGREAFRWTRQTGMVGLGDLPGGNSESFAYAVSGDGATVAGESGSIHMDEAFIWAEKTGMTSVPGMPDGGMHTYGIALSTDGSTLVGYYYGEQPASLYSFSWTATTGVVPLEPQADYWHSPNDASADCSVVVGSRITVNLTYDPFRWTEEPFRWTEETGMVGLGDFPDGSRSSAYGVSADSSVVVGYGQTSSGSEAFRWAQQTGIVGLGNLPGGRSSSSAHAVSADGAIVVGNAYDEVGPAAFIWDAQHGMRKLQDVLVNDYGLDLTGWTLTEATDISDDGLVIVGNGYDPDGNSEAWIAIIPEPGNLCLLVLGVLMVRGGHSKSGRRFVRGV